MDPAIATALSQFHYCPRSEVGVLAMTGKPDKQRKRVYLTVALLVLIALGFYVGFIVFMSMS